MSIHQILLGLGGAAGISATGGTKITSGADTYHVFLTSGSLVVSSGTSDAKILVIGGGGGGGAYAYGGGGGAGGVLYGSSIPITPGTYPITIGAGGAGAVPNGPSSPGSDTVFNTNKTANGGGGGGTWSANAAGKPGGSGGGSSYYTTTAGSATQTPAPGPYTGYGNPSGSGPTGGGKGGGGAGGAGTNYPGPGGSLAGTPGGIGQPFSEFPAPVISPAIPAPVAPRWIPAVGPSGLFAGGGGGAAYYNRPGGTGGPGGGGNAGGNWPVGPVVGDPGVDYTGGGGGGTDYNSGGTSPLNPTYNGGKGGDGIVIVKFTS